MIKKPADTNNHPKLHAFIAHQGYCSRRQAEVLISQGKVRVNGQLAKIGQRVDPTSDQISIDRKPLLVTASQEYTYYLVNKPLGYLSTTSDELNRNTVLDLIPATKDRLYPVGRLDKDSEGLMLLTNDGKFTQQLTHPSFETQKKYLVQLDRPMTLKAIEHLEKGVKLREGYTKPAVVSVIEPEEMPRDKNLTLTQPGDDPTWIEITIHEGRNHQVRRMFQRVGYEVLRLIRIQMGPFTLKQLGGQTYKKITL